MEQKTKRGFRPGRNHVNAVSELGACIVPVVAALRDADVFAVGSRFPATLARLISAALPTEMSNWVFNSRTVRWLEDHVLEFH
jgi:hypothetical protein